MAAKRIAVLLIPDFVMAVFLKAHRSRAHGLVALVDTLTDTAPVVTANQAAQTAGVACGMTAAQAQAFCPGLIVYQRDAITERAESHAIVAWLGSLSPTVNEDIPGRYLLDASGLSLLYPDENAYAERIIVSLRPLGYTVQIGLARNPFVARVAAERAEPSGYLIIAPGREKSFLSGLGREYVAMSANTASLLHDLGIEQIAHLAAFPINEMTERFGPEGAAISAHAHGDDSISSLKRETIHGDGPTTTRFFSSPLAQAWYLSTHLTRMLGELLEQLKPLGQGCACVTVTLHLENRTDHTITLAVANPTLSARPFLRQWQTHIENLSLDSGISGATVTIPHLLPLLMEQLALPTHRTTTPSCGVMPPGLTPTLPCGVMRPRLTPSSSAPVSLPASVHSPRLRPGILPETRFDLLSVSTGRADAKASTDHRHSQRLVKWDMTGLRLLQPPGRCRLHIDHGRLCQVVLNSRRQTITQVIGPWELSGGWWSAAFDRTYYEISTEDRRRYLVFLDRESLQWFLQGVFD